MKVVKMADPTDDESSIKQETYNTMDKQKSVEASLQMA